MLLLTMALGGCGGTPEQRLRRALASTVTGHLQVPAGTVEISSELTLAPGAHDLEIAGAGTLLKAAAGFSGRALLVIDGARNIRLHDFRIDGNRGALARPLDMAPPENAFRVWYPLNGILADRVEGLDVSAIQLANVVNFAVLVSRSSGIRIRNLTVEDSGSRSPQGRNNLSGGILIEEGSKDFEVRECMFTRIAGNGLWTHSLRTSPRLSDGVFAKNHFDTIGRDALEAAHVTRMRVEDNTGSNIGYPVELVDAEHGGTPVAIDTAGNVDHSEYARNSFEEVNGKCIDLDGFHDGAVRENRCLNRKRAEDYLFGHFGIVMNNTDPDVRSEKIEITGNVIDGAKFGGLFVMGSGHTITGNQFVHLDLAGCNESAARFGCIYKADEPAMLQTGIYLGRGVARLEETRGNVIRDNRISGHKMRTRCVAAGPGVSLAANTLERNRCEDDLTQP
ncbi:MAG TPA: hypothetical protein VN841_17880 [Bryobacteraceae bacterium]|nr:hypothetical protein [Bryobacteraceae bacterium]